MIYALTMAGHTHKLQSILFKFSQNIGASSGSDRQSGIVSGSESPTSWSCSLLITCLAVIAWSPSPDWKAEVPIYPECSMTEPDLRGRSLTGPQEVDLPDDLRGHTACSPASWSASRLPLQNLRPSETVLQQSWHPEKMKNIFYWYSCKSRLMLILGCFSEPELIYFVKIYPFKK